MSQQEFENYLALLSRLLRIGPRERDRVAEEFRSHMEDRLDELLARGMARDEAVRQALAEFGDAAGLAAELVSLNRHRRNRWLMRLTTVSVAAVLLIAAGIVTFWPGNNAGPGAGALVAQDPDKPGSTKADPNHGANPLAGSPLTGVPGTSAQETPLAVKLNGRTEADFVETPLKDAIEFLAEKHELQVILKAKRLEEAGVALDSPVTLRLKNVRLSTLLDVMLEDLNLVYTEKDDLVVITTPDDAQATMEVRVYDCRDLLTMPTVGMPQPGTGMPGTGYPGPRSDSSLPGPAPGGLPGGFPGGGFPGGAPGPSLVPGLPGGPPTSDLAPRIPGAPAAAGGSSLGGSFAPDAAPLASEPARGDPLAPPRRPRNDVLPQMLAQNAGGLGGPPSGMMGGMGGGMGGSGMGGAMGGMQPQQPHRPMTPEEVKADQLIEIITTAVNPDTWTEMGGPGTIGEYNGLVVISQSARTHTKIEKVLDMLREAANLPRSPGPRVVR